MESSFALVESCQIVNIKIKVFVANSISAAMYGNSLFSLDSMLVGNICCDIKQSKPLILSSNYKANSKYLCDEHTRIR